MPPALLADENISGVTIRLLRERDFDVLSIAESRPSIRDAEVLDLVCRQQRWLLTFDSDYGSLVFRHLMPAPPGIVCLRSSPRSPEDPFERIMLALARYAGTRPFVVAGRHAGMRVRPLPVHG